jgi:hypothetical protein
MSTNNVRANRRSRLAMLSCGFIKKTFCDGLPEFIEVDANPFNFYA